MVNLRINWTLYTGEECKAKTYCALLAQFETSPTTEGSNVYLFFGFTIVYIFTLCM